MTSTKPAGRPFRHTFYQRVTSRLYCLARDYLGVHLYVVNDRAVSDRDVTDESLPGFTFCRLDLHQLHHAAQDADLDLTLEFIAEAMQRTDECFGAYEHDLLVSYVWRACEWAPHMKTLAVRIAAPYSYTYKVFTRAAYRGRGVWPALSAATNRRCLERGRGRIIGFVEINNFSSLVSTRKLNARRVGIAGFILICGYFIPFSTRAVKRTGFQFFKRAGADLAISG
jgi:GNAT superfamily N-acetyltransferase